MLATISLFRIFTSKAREYKNVIALNTKAMAYHLLRKIIKWIVHFNGSFMCKFFSKDIIPKGAFKVDFKGV